VNENHDSGVEFIHEQTWPDGFEGNHLELVHRRGRLKPYGKQPRQRQCKETRLAPQKDRAARGGEKANNEKGTKVAAAA
jgi:hypothetical protein